MVTYHWCVSCPISTGTFPYVNDLARRYAEKASRRRLLALDCIDRFDRHTGDPAFVVAGGHFDQRASAGKHPRGKLSMNPELPQREIAQHAADQ